MCERLYYMICKRGREAAAESFSSRSFAFRQPTAQREKKRNSVGPTQGEIKF